MARKDPQLALRLPLDVLTWIRQQAERNGSSQTSEVLRALRERMARVEGVHDGMKDPKESPEVL